MWPLALSIVRRPLATTKDRQCYAFHISPLCVHPLESTIVSKALERSGGDEGANGSGVCAVSIMRSVNSLELMPPKAVNGPLWAAPP